MRGCQWNQGRLSGDDKHDQEDHEEPSVEPRKNEDAVDEGNIDVEVDPKEVTVECEGKKTFHDVKDAEKYSIGEEEAIKGEQSLVFYFSHEETGHSMEENKVRERAKKQGKISKCQERWKTK